MPAEYGIIFDMIPYSFIINVILLYHERYQISF